MKDALKVFKALADPTRLRLILLLLRRELCVCELMFILKMEQSRVSHQLRILRDADLVEDRREGKWIVYRIPESCNAALALLLGQFLKGKAKSFRGASGDLRNLEICLREEVRKKHSKPRRRAERKR